MSTLEKLNDLYIRIKKEETALGDCEKAVAETQQSRNLSEREKVDKTVGELSEMQEEISGVKTTIFKDIVTVGEQYSHCRDAIDTYQNALLRLKNGGRELIPLAVATLKSTQSGYDKAKAAFYKKYQYTIDSVDAFMGVSVASTKSVCAAVHKKAEELKQEAKAVVNKEYSTELKMNDPLREKPELPLQLLVARQPVSGVTYDILKDIGIASVYQNTQIDLREQGNILLTADFREMEDTAIDEFIAAYILRYIETFPLGAVNVHIFDDNTNFLYRRLSNAFQSGDSGEETRRTVQIHTSIKELEAFDSVCDDIFKKTSVNKPDLYAVYETDRSDPFTLIVLRDGLNIDGYSINNSILNTISSLTKPGATGHKCGIRFLIVYNQNSATQSEKKSAHLLKTIEQNCCLKLNYERGKGFSLDGKPVEVLHISENVDAYIQERAAMIAASINGKKRSYISLDEVAAGEGNNRPGSILTIPIGKSGDSIIELPLSCKDTEGTVAGQCIGYMAIGQTGSGKSAFFHSLVLNACMKYSPRDLQFWLLDFKNGGASSKYSGSGIPHVRIIAEDNKVDDALCLFQMVLEEMERRTKTFNRAFTDNILDYNEIAHEQGLEYFPRIIIAIDEVQEIFRDDSASTLQKLIASISTRMRSAGMHFVMVAQNLSEGRSDILKDSFLPSATGRVCFRVEQNIPANSGFGEEFTQRRKDISELKTGEAYISYGKGTIRKVKIAYISPQEMNEKYFPRIRKMYPKYMNSNPLVIGAKTRLSIDAMRQGTNESYLDIMQKQKSSRGVCQALIGEDVYRMSPFTVRFSQLENSSLLFLGGNRAMASSMCASVAASLMLQDATVHLFNGDRTRLYDGNEAYMHPFMAVCQSAARNNGAVRSHRLNQFKEVIRDVYAEYLSRQSQVQKAEFEDPEFSPIIVVVNDLFGIECFNQNEEVQNLEAEDTRQVETGGLNFGGHDIFSDFSFSDNRTDGRFRAQLQDIIKTLAQNGYRYNIHAVLAIRGDPSNWRIGSINALASNVILFNETEYADQLNNSYYLKEMLKNISNETGDETLAVWSGKSTYSKIRPIIYDMANQQESTALQSLIKGE